MDEGIYTDIVKLMQRMSSIESQVSKLYERIIELCTDYEKTSEKIGIMQEDINNMEVSI